MGGLKFDKEKLRWDLLPIEPVEAVIRVMMLGSDKYNDDNWKFVPECRRRYYAAALRHLTAWWKGEKLDPESGISHLTHATCCLLFLAWHETYQTKEFLEEQDNFIEDKRQEEKEEEERKHDTNIFEDVGARIRKWLRY